MDKLQLSDAARLKQILALRELVLQNSSSPTVFLERSCQAVAHYLAMPITAVVQPYPDQWKVIAFHGSSAGRATLAAILQGNVLQAKPHSLPTNRLVETPDRGTQRLVAVPFHQEKALLILNHDPRDLSSEELWVADCLGSLLGSAFAHLDEQARLTSSQREALAAIVAMAHDLRSPLNVITGYANLLREGAYGPLSEKQQEVIAALEVQAQTLLSLLGGALDLARLETLGMSEAKGAISLAELIDDLVSAARSRTAGRELVIDWSVTTDVPELLIEKGHLQHIIQNLLDNAIGATPRGKITVTASYDQEREAALITVADTGKGLDPADIPRLFELFNNGSTMPQRPPTRGCGLYLVRKFCEKLGAEINVEGQLGKGATFTVEIPVKGRRLASD